MPDDSYIVGDSIAQGLIDTSGVPGTARVGASPSAVLDNINSLDDEVKGKTVYLSSGVSNNPGQIGLVDKQRQALLDKGAGRVVLVGTGSRKDLAPLNSSLGTTPLETGPDGVHPANYGSLWSQLSGGFAGKIRDLGERSADTAVSPAGARSSMQVLPSTAASPGFGIAPAANNSLTEFNRVGVDYANAMLAKYGGNQTLASAAYNAGPGRVDQWIQQFGDPRTGQISDQDWASKIPVAETRNYAARVNGLSLPGTLPHQLNLNPTPSNPFVPPNPNDLGVGLATGSGGSPQSLLAALLQHTNTPTGAAPNPMIALQLIKSLLPKTHTIEQVDYDPWAIQKKGETA